MRRVIYIMGFPEYLTNLSLSKIGYLMAVTGWKYLIHNQHLISFYFPLTKLYTLNSTVCKLYNIYAYSITLLKVCFLVFWGLLFLFFFSYRICFSLAIKQTCFKCVLINFCSFRVEVTALLLLTYHFLRSVAEWNIFVRIKW